MNMTFLSAYLRFALAGCRANGYAELTCGLLASHCLLRFTETWLRLSFGKSAASGCWGADIPKRASPAFTPCPSICCTFLFLCVMVRALLLVFILLLLLYRTILLLAAILPAVMPCIAAVHVSIVVEAVFANWC